MLLVIINLTLNTPQADATALDFVAGLYLAGTKQKK